MTLDDPTSALGYTSECDNEKFIPIAAFSPGDSAGTFEQGCLRNCGFGCKVAMTLQSRFCPPRTERLESEHVLSLRLP